MYRGLNAYRAFAFLTVFLYHELKFAGGYLGVDAFFVLSGFLIIPILAEMKSSLSGKDFFVHFYGRRALRILPLYFFYLAVVALISCIVLAEGSFAGKERMVLFLKELPWAATFTLNFHHASRFYEQTPLITHFWSLAVEEQFYLLWPVVLFFVPTARLKQALLVFIVAGPFIRLALASSWFAGVFPDLSPRTDQMIYVLPFSHLDAFAIGGYVALHGRSRSARAVWFFLGATLAVGYLTAWLSTGSFQPGHLGYSPFLADSGKMIWGYTLLNALFAYVLLHLRDGKFLPALFENPVLDYLGKISYGLYVYHYAIVWYINSSMKSTPELIRIPLALAATIAISALSFELMEKKFTGLKDRYFQRASSPVVSG